MTKQDLIEWKEEILEQQKETGGEIYQFVEGNDLLELIETIKLKDKIIDKMAEELKTNIVNSQGILVELLNIPNREKKQIVKDYFYKEIENE